MFIFFSLYRNVHEQISEADILKNKLDVLQDSFCKLSQTEIRTNNNINKLNEMLRLIEKKISKY